MKKLLALVFFFGFFNMAGAQMSPPYGGLNNISFPFSSVGAMVDYWLQYRAPAQPVMPSVSPAASALYMSRTATLPICTSRHIAHCKTGQDVHFNPINGNEMYCSWVAQQWPFPSGYDASMPCQGNRNSCVPLKTFCRIGTPTPIPVPTPPKPKPKPIPSRCGIFTSQRICEAAQCQWEMTFAPCLSGSQCAGGGICRDPDQQQPVACIATDTSCDTDSDCANTPITHFCQDIGPLAGNKKCTNGSSQCKRRCLSKSTKISTPIGDVAVTSLKVGDIVWTADRAGNRVVRTLVKVSRFPAPNHRVAQLVLTDGRSLDVSALHPAVGGIMVGDLQAGDVYDGSIVKSAAVKPYEGTATYDILPAGDTGYYWANGILMGSTLK